MKQFVPNLREKLDPPNSPDSALTVVIIIRDQVERIGGESLITLSPESASGLFSEILEWGNSKSLRSESTTDLCPLWQQFFSDQGWVGALSFFWFPSHPTTTSISSLTSDPAHHSDLQTGSGRAANKNGATPPSLILFSWHPWPKAPCWWRPSDTQLFTRLFSFKPKMGEKLLNATKKCPEHRQTFINPVLQSSVNQAFLSTFPPL